MTCPSIAGYANSISLSLSVVVGSMVRGMRPGLMRVTVLEP